MTVTSKDGVITVEINVTRRKYMYLSDYNPYRRELCFIRTIQFSPKPGEFARMLHVLKSREYHIYYIISHEPVVSGNVSAEQFNEIADKQRVYINDEPFLDEFGFHVYMTARISTEFTPDVDMRYGDIPNMDPEILNV